MLFKALSDKKSRRLLKLLSIVSMFMVYSGFAKEVCQVKYKGDITELKDKNMNVDERSVAMSSEVKVKRPIGTTVTKIAPASIFFIIDNSTSMHSTDKQGSRFRVTRDLVDTIKVKFDSLAEVGLSTFTKYLYFRPQNDGIFTKCPGWDSGSYIPLLNLNQIYPVSGNRSGYTILKFYLDTIVRSGGGGGGGYVDLKYQPTPQWGGGGGGGGGQGTNISTAFDAAKEAFKVSKITDKRRHFIIFLSDGEANAPEDQTLQNKFIKGENTPTTFTVFFTSSTTPPIQLQTMTDNIKKNNYSTKNPSSNIWAIQTDYPTLMKLLIDSVLNVITNTTQNTTDSISVNGVQVTIYDSLNNQFVFTNQFPLVGVKTDFNYRVKYTVHKVVINGNDTQIVPIDSFAQGDYSITIQPQITTPDTFAVTCWDRNFSFYNNNIKITALNETMTQLDIRFTYDQGTAKYNYTKATIEVTTAGNGTTKDRELVDFIKNGNTFVGLFPLEVTDVPAVNDKKLQVRFNDKIYVVFRNGEKTKLPLDTLRDSIGYKVSGTITTKEAFYYDNAGDGFIDSVYVTVDNPINDTQLKEIYDKKLITLPGERIFTINNFIRLSNTAFAILVSQGKTALGEPTTYSKDYDKLVTQQYVFPSGGWLFGGTIDIQDRIAPIIMRARAVVDYGPKKNGDTLWVTFSEPINPVTNAVSLEPFNFIRHDNNPPLNFTPVLGDQFSMQSDSKRFIINSYGSNPNVQKFKQGDSIWINTLSNTTYIGDIVTPSNFQMYATNTRRMLDVQLIVPEIELKIISTGPTMTGSEQCNTILNSIKTNITNPNFLTVDNNNEFTGKVTMGILIQVEPVYLLADSAKISSIKEMKGSLDIYDVLGNLLKKDVTMQYDPTHNKKVLRYAWNGKNIQNRDVGSGTYLAIAKVTIVMKSEAETIKTLKTFIGIKEPKGF
jgi:hypothetical protein